MSEGIRPVSMTDYRSVMTRGTPEQKKALMGEFARQRWNKQHPTLRVDASSVSPEVQESVKNTIRTQEVLGRVITGMKKRRRIASLLK